MDRYKSICIFILKKQVRLPLINVGIFYASNRVRIVLTVYNVLTPFFGVKFREVLSWHRSPKEQRVARSCLKSFAQPRSAAKPHSTTTTSFEHVGRFDTDSPDYWALRNELEIEEGNACASRHFVPWFVLASPPIPNKYASAKLALLQRCARLAY